MVGLPVLWMPIVVSAVFVLIALLIIHGMIGCHKADNGEINMGKRLTRWRHLRADHRRDVRLAVATLTSTPRDAGGPG